MAFVDSTLDPLAGFWRPTHLQGMYYGAGSVERHLIKSLPSESSKAFIITGSSLATKTDLIKQVENHLGPQHAGTFSNIKQHSPLEQLDKILSTVMAEESIDTVISVGGGSPIDSSKAISYRFHQQRGRFLHHVSIPTTLSAAECTMGAGLTNENGLKTQIVDANIGPKVIIYDALFAKATPSDLWMTTAFRSLDHCVELMYHPTVWLNS